LVSWHCYIQDAILLLPALALLLPSSPSPAVRIPLALAFVPLSFWMLSAPPPWSAAPPLLLALTLAGACLDSFRPIPALTEGNLAFPVEIHQN
jgi:hypothetical protein